MERLFAMTRAISLSELEPLPPAVDLLTAAGLLGIGRTTAYQLARAGRFPVPVLRIGGGYKVPTAPLLDLLGRPAPGAVSAATPQPAARAVSMPDVVPQAESGTGAGVTSGRCGGCGRFFEPVEGS
jgi:hypothetical protein